MKMHLNPPHSALLPGNTLFTLGAHFQQLPPPPPAAHQTSHFASNQLLQHNQQQQPFGPNIGAPNAGAGAGGGGAGTGFSAYSTILFSNTGGPAEMQLSAAASHQQQQPQQLQSFCGPAAAHQQHLAGIGNNMMTHSPPIQVNSLIF